MCIGKEGSVTGDDPSGLNVQLCTGDYATSACIAGADNGQSLMLAIHCRASMRVYYFLVDPYLHALAAADYKWCYIETS